MAATIAASEAIAASGGNARVGGRSRGQFEVSALAIHGERKLEEVPAEVLKAGT
jgi:hypothetical protein